MTDVSVLRDKYRQEKQALWSSISDSAANGRGLKPTLVRLAKLADKLLIELWSQAGFDQGEALIAVGGYGRGELFPSSDVDVLVMLPDSVIAEDSPELKAKLETFIGSCWDSGLEIGSSVRTLSDCIEESEKDITVKTSLLESRLITGHKKLYTQFQKRYEEAMDPHAFFVAKTLELNQRHNKFENTPYSLEPNCKESPGGLRDLQIILWVSRAAGLGRTWDDLAAKGLATPLEVKQIKRNEAVLSLIRARLHLLAKRREDRLVFDLQHALAETFGYKAKSTPDGKHKQRASEVLMRQYYWAAKAVTQLNEILIQNIEALIFPQKAVTPLPLSEYFIDRQGQLDILDPLLFEKKPDQILVTFLLFASYSQLTGFSTQTMRAIYNARELMNASWRNQPENRQVFLAIIKQTTGITRTLHLMNQTSVLGRYLPPFRKIVGQMQHDLFHVYTVDQHIMTVLKNVRRFFVAELAHEFPFCSELAANFDQSWILVLGAIFHDIAKGRGGDHSELGKKDVKLFCTQHGIAKEDADLVSF